MQSPLSAKKMLQLLHDLGNYMGSIVGHLHILQSLQPPTALGKLVDVSLDQSEAMITAIESFRKRCTTVQESDGTYVARSFANTLLSHLNQLLELKAHNTDKCDPSIRHELHAIISARVHAAELVYRLAPELRKSEVPSRDIYLETLLKSTTRLTHKAAQKNRVEIRLVPDSNDWLVTGNETDLCRAFLNLMINSIEAMPTGGDLRIKISKLAVTKEAQLKAATAVQVDFIDSGAGISPEHKENVFLDHFSTKGPHRGIGLSIVHRIISEHAGILTFHSNPSMGTTFCVCLPAKLRVRD